MPKEKSSKAYLLRQWIDGNPTLTTDGNVVLCQVCEKHVSFIFAFSILKINVIFELLTSFVVNENKLILFLYHCCRCPVIKNSRLHNIYKQLLIEMLFIKMSQRSRQPYQQHFLQAEVEMMAKIIFRKISAKL